MIPFIQYMRPNGRQVSVDFECDDPEIENMACKIIAKGYQFEVEELSTGDISMTIYGPWVSAYRVAGDECGDIVCEICKNDVSVVSAVKKLVLSGCEKIFGESDG